MPRIPRPANYAQLSAMDKRAFNIRVNEIDAKMSRLLEKLPAATPQNRAQIEARLANLDPFERERSNEVLREALTEGALK